MGTDGRTDGLTDTTTLTVFAILRRRLKSVEKTPLGISRHRWEDLKNTRCEDVSTFKVGHDKHQETVLTQKEMRLWTSQQTENFTTNQVIYESCKESVNKLKGSRRA
jgi:hypothetical protein